jgi:hypothetical protein
MEGGITFVILQGVSHLVCSHGYGRQRMPIMPLG